MTAIDTDHKLRNLARNLEKTGRLYRDGKIDICSAKIAMRQTIVSLQDEIRKTDDEWRHFAEVTGNEQ